MNCLSKVIADFVGEIGASFHSNLEREKGKAREEAKIARANQIQQILEVGKQQYYVTIDEMLFEALLSTSEITYISRPQNEEALFSTQPVAWHKRGFAYFTYQGIFYRSAITNGKISLKKMRRILQDALNVQTYKFGFSPLKIFIQIYGDNRIMFRIAFQQDITRVKAAMRGSHVTRQ